MKGGVLRPPKRGTYFCRNFRLEKLLTLDHEDRADKIKSTTNSVNLFSIKYRRERDFYRAISNQTERENNRTHLQKSRP